MVKFEDIINLLNDKKNQLAFQEEDITVVLQGAIENKITKKSLRSIRKYLPKAEVILSTYKNKNIVQLDNLYDILILNKDPGGVIFDDTEQKNNNINRIIVSSFNGIKAANRKYVLRLRSDLVLKNNNFLKLTDELKKRDAKWALFKQKIYAYDIFSIKYEIGKNTKQRMPFHISDWCYFGLKEDLEKLFNIPLVLEPEFSRYFENNKKETTDIHTSRLWKMSPEQYIVSQNAKKIFSEFDFNHYLDVNKDNIKVSEQFIINNFRVFSQKQWGIYTQKKLYKNVKMFCLNPFDYYSEVEQIKDYNKYLNSNIQIKYMKFLEWLYRNKYYEKFKKHFFQLIFGNLSKKISELISTMYYFFKFILSILKENNTQKSKK